MKKKSTYIAPLTEIFIVEITEFCGVKFSKAEGKSGYDDISTIGGDDDDNIAPTSNNIWFDADEN